MTTNTINNFEELRQQLIALGGNAHPDYIAEAVECYIDYECPDDIEEEPILFDASAATDILRTLMIEEASSRIEAMGCMSLSTNDDYRVYYNNSRQLDKTNKASFIIETLTHSFWASFAEGWDIGVELPEPINEAFSVNDNGYYGCSVALEVSMNVEDILQPHYEEVFDKLKNALDDACQCYSEEVYERNADAIYEAEALEQSVEAA
jgi:uncharacterized protein (UPF0332 family)